MKANARSMVSSVGPDAASASESDTDSGDRSRVSATEVEEDEDEEGVEMCGESGEAGANAPVIQSAFAENALMVGGEMYKS